MNFGRLEFHFFRCHHDVKIRVLFPGVRMICWAQQAGNIQFRSVTRHAVFLFLRFFLTDRQFFYLCRYFLQLAAFITHVVILTTRNSVKTVIRGTFTAHRRATTERASIDSTRDSRIKPALKRVRYEHQRWSAISRTSVAATSTTTSTSGTRMSSNDSCALGNGCR